jgi:hypothetical protein
MSNEPRNNEPTDSEKEPTESAEEPPPDDGEFKITVRKLTMPVRPRGVLAE